MAGALRCSIQSGSGVAGHRTLLACRDHAFAPRVTGSDKVSDDLPAAEVAGRLDDASSRTDRGEREPPPAAAEHRRRRGRRHEKPPQSDRLRRRGRLGPTCRSIVAIYYHHPGGLAEPEKRE